jgi:hypothetical protein
LLALIGLFPNVKKLHITEIFKIADEEEEKKEENEVWNKRNLKEGVDTLVFETNYTDFE